jgi:hypothetical protein
VNLLRSPLVVSILQAVAVWANRATKIFRKIESLDSQISKRKLTPDWIGHPDKLFRIILGASGNVHSMRAFGRFALMAFGR